jgi:hypothetical protein
VSRFAAGGEEVNVVETKSGTAAMGHGGWCVCVACGHREPHRAGVPCREERCPACGKAMLREGSAHHQAFLAKKGKAGGEGER